MKLTQEVSTLANDPQPGEFRVCCGGAGGPHPADNMTADMEMGGGAFMTFINPQSFADGGPEWTCRYGNIVGIRYTVANLLESYDYLLSSNINMQEATRRLRLLRAGRRALATKEEGDE